MSDFKEKVMYSKRTIVFCVLLFVVALFFVGVVVKNNSIKSKAKSIANFKYYKEYNQSHKIKDYTITLKYGMYSDKTKNGRCIFEIEKANGSVENPEFFNGNQIDFFGKEKIQICINATGTICNRAEVDGDKLIVYSDFKAGNLEVRELENFNKHQVILYYAGEEEAKCANGYYGFKLEDNIAGKEYEVDDSTILAVSYLGVSVKSQNKLDSLKVEVVKSGGEKDVLLELGAEVDIKGTYGEGYLETAGKKQYTYSYNFSDFYNVESIEEIYVNDKKIY